MLDPTTGAPTNATLDDYKLPTISDSPEIVIDFIDMPDRDRVEHRRQGARRAADHPHGGGDRQRLRARDRAPQPRPAADAEAGPGGARVTLGYERPATLDEACELLAKPGALPLFGGTDLMGQIDRGIVTPELLVDMQQVGLDTIERDAAADWRSAPPSRSPTIAAAELRGTSTRRSRRPRRSPRRRHCVTLARSAGTSARAPAAGTTAARSGTAGSAAATPATPRSATTASTTCSPATASRRTPPIWRPRSRPAARAWSCAARPGSASSSCSISTAPPPRTTARCSRSRTARSSARSSALPPAPEAASAYRRLGERQAFSFPLVAVAAARRDGTVHAVAGGVANIPVRRSTSARSARGAAGQPADDVEADRVLATLRRTRRRRARRMP